MNTQITSDIILVTPDVAEQWLGKNIDNRRIKRQHVDKLAQDMAADRWHMTDESIKFDRDGRLIDGQHRLLAVVKSGASILLRVTRGLDPESQKFMDTASSRTAADALGFDGKSHTALLAAIARIALAVDAGKVHLRGYPATHAEILAWVDQNPLAEESAAFASRYARKTDCRPALVGYTHLRLSEVDAQDAADFWIAAAEKVNLRPGDPVMAMYNRFAEARRNREMLGNDACLSLIYRAWNYRRQGKQWKTARINSPGVNGGLIPVPEPK